MEGEGLKVGIDFKVKHPAPAIVIPEALTGQVLPQITKEKKGEPKPAGDVRGWQDILSLPTAPPVERLLEDRKSKKGRIYKGLSKEGKQFLNGQFSEILKPDEEGYVDRAKAQELLDRLKEQGKPEKDQPKTDYQIFSEITAKKLEIQMRRADEIDARAMMEVSNSPWIGAEEAIVKRLAEAGISEALTKKTLTQTVRRYIAEIRKITDGSMEQDLMFHHLAYDMQEAVATLELPADEKLLKQAKASDVVKQLLIKAAGGRMEETIEYHPVSAFKAELSGIDESLKEIKGRRDTVSGELRKTLNQKKHEIRGKLREMREKRARLKEEYEKQVRLATLRSRLKIEAPEFILKDHWRLARMPDWDEMMPIKKLDEMTIDEQREFTSEYVRRRNATQGDWYTDPFVAEVLDDGLKIQDFIKNKINSISDADSLYQALLELAKERGEERMDTLTNMLEEKWLSKERKDLIWEELHKLQIAKGRKRQGIAGKLMGGAAFGERIIKKASALIRHKDLDDFPSGRMGQKYERYLYRKGSDLTIAREKMIKTNALRLGMTFVNMAANLYHPPLPSILEGSPDLHFLTDQSAEGDNGNLLTDAVSYVATLLNAEPAKAMGIEESAIDEILGPSEASEITTVTDASPSPEISESGEAEQAGTTPMEEVEQPGQIQHQEAISTDNYIEVKAIGEAVEADNPFEFFLGPLFSEFKEALDERIGAMNPDERQEFFEVMGGEENLKDRTTMNIAILGKDTGEEREDIYGNEGRADQILILSFNAESGEVKVTSLDRYIKSPELNGDPINTMTWYDQEKLAKGGENLYGSENLYSPELQRDILEHATGLPVDAIFDINLDSFKALADTVFSEGLEVTVREGEGFYNKCIA